MIEPQVSETRYPACDVLVLGGGMAGIAAAIAAAHQGANTVLVDKAGWLGGMGAVGATGLHSYFNVFDAHPGAERARVVAGMPKRRQIGQAVETAAYPLQFTSVPHGIERAWLHDQGNDVPGSEQATVFAEDGLGFLRVAFLSHGRTA